MTFGDQREDAGMSTQAVAEGTWAELLGRLLDLGGADAALD